jgi:hypothetical protein
MSHRHLALKYVKHRTRWWMRGLVAMWLALGSGALYALAPPYVLTLEWPVDEAGPHTVQVQDGDGAVPLTGLAYSAVIRYDDHYRQYLSLSPELARCDGTQRWVFTLELPDDSAASLRLTRLYQPLAHWPQAQAAFGEAGQALTLDLSHEICPPSSSERGDAIVGELTLAVDRPAPGTTLWADVGHAWVEFRPLVADLPIPSPLLTLGTYSNALRDGASSGLNINRELGRVPDAYKTVALTAEQLTRVIAEVQRYQAAGAAAWTIDHNCTGFATTIWAIATGEWLSATQSYPDASWDVLLLGIPNAGSLYHALKASSGSVVLDE